MPHTNHHDDWARRLVCTAIALAFIAPGIALAGPAGDGAAAEPRDDRRGAGGRSSASEDDRFAPRRARTDGGSPETDFDERYDDRERRWRSARDAESRIEERRERDRDGPRYLTKAPNGFGPIGARARAIYAQLDGKVEKETLAGAGNEIRLARDLDIERTEWVPKTGIFAKIGDSLELGVDYLYASFQGEAVLTGTTVSLHGNLFNPGESLRSRTTLHDVSIGASYTLLDVGFLELSLPFGFRYINFETEIRSNSGLRASERTETLMPYVGFGIDAFPVEFIRLGAGLRLGGSTYHEGKDLAGFAQLETTAAFVWDDRVEVGVGYDFVSVDIEQDEGADEQVDYELGGPFLFVSVKF